MGAVPGPRCSSEPRTVPREPRAHFFSVPTAVAGFVPPGVPWELTGPKVTQDGDWIPSLLSPDFALYMVVLMLRVES